MISAAPRRDSSRLRHVLLVDRDDDTREMYAEYFAAAAVSIQQAADGRDALARAIARPPDLVVTETRLPGLDGYELCALLRGEPKTRTVPIVVVTGDGYQADVAHARSAGADLVLIKPCLPEVLLAEMRRLVAQTPDKRDARLPRRPGPRCRGQGSARTRPSLPPHRRFWCVPRAINFSSTSAAMSGQQYTVGPRQGEQWDYFECAAGCGVFQYRQRTQGAAAGVTSPVVRPGREADLPALTDIYNHYVINTPITFDLFPFTVEQRREWFVEHAGADGTGCWWRRRAGQVVGYATTSRFRVKAAYDTTVESSIYCRADCVRRGNRHGALPGAVRGAEGRGHQPHRRGDYAAEPRVNRAARALRVPQRRRALERGPKVRHLLGRRLVRAPAPRNLNR